VGRLGVGEHEGVLVGRVLEVVVDPELLHEPLHEGEVRLPVLHAVLDPGVVLRQAALEVREARVVEHLGDDVRGGHVREDPAVRRWPSSQSHGAQRQPVGESLVARAHPLGLGEHAVEEALGPVAGPEAHGAVEADRPVEIDVLAVAERVDPVLEQFAQAFAALEAGEHQDILPQRGW
jgi:hypothetical protein